MAGIKTPTHAGRAELTFAAGTTSYVIAANTGWIVDTVEAENQVTYETAGTLSNLYIYVNTVSGTGTRTLRTRVNNANGGQSLTFTGTGEFEDTSGTDSISVGDEVNYSLNQPAANTCGVTAFRTHWLPTTDRVVSMRYHAKGPVTYNVASVTRYTNIAGALLSTGASESNYITPVYGSMTLKNMFLYVTSNARTNNTTYRVRVNSANGNQNIVVGSGGTGIYEDTSNTDSVVSGDTINYSSTTGTGTDALVLENIGVEAQSSLTSYGQYIGGGPSGNAIPAGTAAYGAIAANIGETTDSVSQAHTLGVKFNCTYAAVTVQTNTITVGNGLVAPTFTPGGSCQIAITGGATGTLEQAPIGQVGPDANSTSFVQYNGATTGSYTFRAIVTVAYFTNPSYFLPILGVG